MERLQKAIASSGITSRRKAEDLIRAGKVYVNGKLVTEMGYIVESSDQITVDGVNIKKENKVYYLLNKPAGYICSLDDEKNRPIITDLVETNARVYPVGRLDYNTTGVILLTNDGELSNILTHPTKHVPKTYVAKLNKSISIEDIVKLKKGIMIDNIVCKPTRVKLKSSNEHASVVEITIVEGRNHIVKKVFASMGYKVIKLDRTKYAFFDVSELKRGFYRELTIKEVKKLYEYKN